MREQNKPKEWGAGRLPETVKRIPWQSSGYAATLSLLRDPVRSLVGELRSHKPRSAAKKNKNKLN